MSITPKEQFEDAIAENARLRRELDAAQAESAEARGNVEKALRELAEEVHKRQKAEAKCAEMRSCIAWLNSHQQSPLETAWNDHVQHALSSDFGADYVPKAELDEARKREIDMAGTILAHAEAYNKHEQIIRHFENGVKDSSGTIDEGEVIAGQIYEQAKKALAAAKSLEVL